MPYTLNSKIPIIQNNATINKTLKFLSTDDEENFLSNKEKMGESWYYHSKDIDYSYNSWGYRTKEFDDLKNDYILTFGCSFTEGVGLYYNDMWSTKLGEKLNLDVFNLGLGATGVDFQFYNTVLFYNFVKNKNKLPKYVIYQWPFEHRTTHCLLDNLDGLTFIPISNGCLPDQIKNLENWYNNGFVENEGELIKQSNIYPMTCNLLWESVGVKVLNWTWENDFNMKNNEIFSNFIKIHKIKDTTTNIYARDGRHNGHLSQDLVVNNLLKLI